MFAHLGPFTPTTHHDAGYDPGISDHTDRLLGFRVEGL
jgi:hypothetical protein